MPTINDVMEMAELLRSRSVVPVEDRCVAVRNRNASCLKCAQVCIASAIEVGQNKITVDAGACVGCGACVAVCPTSALVSLDPMDEDLVSSLLAAVRGAKSMAVVSCARMASRRLGDPEKFATVPCLGRVDERMIVALAGMGVEDIVLVDGDCTTCKYGAVSAAVDETVESAVRLFEMIGASAIVTRCSEFPREVLAEDERKVIGAARRGFFSQASGIARNVAVTAAEKAIDDALHQSKQRKLLTLRERLGAGKSGKLPTIQPERNLFLLDELWKIAQRRADAEAEADTPVPEDAGAFPVALAEEAIDTRLFGSIEIDPADCSGCGMCVMFCPTAALKYSTTDEPDDAESRYLEFQASDCTQCGLCVDVCLRGSVTLSSHVACAELFDFEPKLIEISRPKKGNFLFTRNKPKK